MCLHYRAVGIANLYALALESDHTTTTWELSWMETSLSFLEKGLAWYWMHLYVLPSKIKTRGWGWGSEICLCGLILTLKNKVYEPVGK